MIERNIKPEKKGKPLKNILDYIKFEGAGLGYIEATGKIVKGEEVVTEVKVHFNAKGKRSPVTAGIYSVMPHDGKSEKYDRLVARVNTLTFSRTGEKPKMAMQLGSVYSYQGKEGFGGRLKAFIANLFIPPLDITAIGNDTMLDFGYALYKEKQTFTFPKATNLKIQQEVVSKK